MIQARPTNSGARKYKEKSDIPTKNGGIVTARIQGKKRRICK